MRYRLLVLVLLVAAPLWAASFSPLDSGIAWTYHSDPPLDTTRQHFLGSFTAWNGQYGYPQIEIVGSTAQPTTHWTLDGDGRLVLQGIDWGAPEMGGSWYFDPAPVYLDDQLLAGESIMTDAGVFQATENVDIWYGLRPVTVHCLARDQVDTPYGTVAGITVEVTWDDDPTGAPWTYAYQERRTYGEGLGLVSIASLLNPGIVYRLTEVTGLVITRSELPSAEVWLTAAPTPFNPNTTFRFALVEAGRVELAVFDLAGRRIDTIAQGHHQAGAHAISWQPRNLASGVYLARLVTSAGTSTTQVTLVE